MCFAHYLSHQVSGISFSNRSAMLDICKTKQSKTGLRYRIGCLNFVRKPEGATSSKELGRGDYHWSSCSKCQEGTGET